MGNRVDARERVKPEKPATQGTWLVVHDERRREWLVTDQSGVRIIASFPDYEGDAESNAWLVASSVNAYAAMRDVCEGLISDREACGIDETDADDPLARLVRYARAAVAKAEHVVVLRRTKAIPPTPFAPADDLSQETADKPAARVVTHEHSQLVPGIDDVSQIHRRRQREADEGDMHAARNRPPTHEEV